jgi:uncharacterized membrane protein YgcG
VQIRRPPARRAWPPGPPRSPRDRLLDVLAAAAGAWAAVALVLAVLLALAVTVALVLVAGLAVADAASYHEPQARLGAGSTGGVRNAGSESRSSASSGAAAAASLSVSGGRFHLRSTSFSTDV